MPLFDFKCSSCGKVEEKLIKISELPAIADGTRPLQCPDPNCNGLMQKQLSCPKFVPFKAGWYEHFTDKPIYIGSKRELKEACEKYDKGSVYLDDM